MVVGLLGLVVALGCKKASTEDVIEGGTAEAGAAAASGSSGADQAGAAGSGSAAVGSESAAAAGSGSAAPTGSAAEASGDAAAAGTAGDSGAGSGPASGADGGGGAGSEPGAGKTADPNPSQPGAPAGIVEFVALNASGGTTDAALKAALDKAKNRYRGCYGKALASDSSTQGTLKLRATIAADGVVEKVDVIGGNLGLSPLVQCSVATTKSLKIAGAAAPATKATFDVKFSK